jgi:methionine sulfoxide reductase heme-binding subunit
VALFFYIETAPEAFWVGRTPATNIPGSIGYVMILLMTITSFKAPARFIGAENWRRLHLTGMWVIAAIFAVSFISRIPHGIGYAGAAVTMIAAMLLRGVARFRSGSRTRPSPTAV